MHNFQEQNVAQIEEPTATCVAHSADSELLLLALQSHCIEVHDLTTPDLKLVTIFPTVDLASQLIHCSKGDYVAALESKCSRDGESDNKFVRVYVNWTTSDQSQAMRARIAGRVTPSLNRPMNSLEMIELPLNLQPVIIACCQATGNLLVAGRTTAILHEFKIETLQPTKLQFLDFEPRPWALDLSFTPTHMEIVEDFVSVMNSSHFLIFRLTNPLYEDIDHLSSLTSENSCSKSTQSTNRSDCDNSSSAETPSKVLQNGNSSKFSEHDKNFFNSQSTRNFNSSWLQAVKSRAIDGKFIDWDRLIHNEREEINSLIRQELISSASEPFTVNFPSISLERAGPGHTLSPFILNSPDTEVFIKTTSPDSGWSENFAIKSVLRLEIAKESFSSRDYFSASILKPLYLETKENNSCLKKCILKSERYKYLHGITCLICTSQEGYIYHFAADNLEEFSPTCLTTYTFTAPVTHVALEHTVLHALTEAGLESYTLRISHHVAKNFINTFESEEICPDVTEPVCLIGLRPFLGIETILSTKKSIVLLAKAENTWTLYSLKLPNPDEIYVDILNAARNHKSTSPTTYRHLLEEAHAIVRLAKDVIRFDFPPQPRSTLNDLYDQSCMLLGDYYIESDLESDWRLSIPYYKMSGLKVNQVLSRKSAKNAPGLVVFLTESLLTMKSGVEADELFQSHNVVDIIGTETKEGLLKLILGSSVLQEYATDKLIKLLESHEYDDYNRLALILLYTEAGRDELVEQVMEPISGVFIEQMILEYPHLLFDDSNVNIKKSETLSFSNFSGALMRWKSNVFAEILTQLINDDTLTLYQIMQVFLEYLPSRVGRDGHDAAAALQFFIEIYLRKYFKLDKKKGVYDFATIEAFKILVRSYLGRLIQSNPVDWRKKHNNEEIHLFANKRPVYLNKMPPCSKNYGLDLNSEIIDELADGEIEKNVRCEILKLQALIASGYLPGECLQEILQFLETEEILGSLSLKSLCNQDTEMVSKILLEQCPQVILFYAKDTYTKEQEWKALIEMLQNQILLVKINQGLTSFFEQTLIDTLTHVAKTLPLQALHNILPKDDRESYEHYMQIHSQILRADRIKSVMMKTGNQFLSKLNL